VQWPAGGLRWIQTWAQAASYPKTRETNYEWKMQVQTVPGFVSYFSLPASNLTSTIGDFLAIFGTSSEILGYFSLRVIRKTQLLILIQRNYTRRARAPVTNAISYGSNYV